MSNSLADTEQPRTDLTDEEVVRYRRDGYLAVDNIFTSAEVDELRAVTDEFVERSRKVTGGDHVFDLEPDHSAEHPRLRRIKLPHEQHPVYRRALTNERLLDIVGQLIGDNIRFQGGKLNMKASGGGAPVEWHQDWAFFPHTNDDILAVGIALDEMTVENGGLMVVPGSHQGPIHDHHEDGRFVGAVAPGEWSDRTVGLSLQPGGVSLHHVRLLHGSAPNTSGRPRRLLLFEYVAADAWPLTEGETWDQILARTVRGDLPVAIRMEHLPVRVPFPRAKGTIFEVQSMSKVRGFA